jgi:DNA-binding NtrC family response regulator
MRKAPLQEQLSDVWAALNWPKEARSSTMKSESFLIAATNRDLQAAIALGSFRSDLFLPAQCFPH